MLISVINFPNGYKKNVFALVDQKENKWVKLHITSTLQTPQEKDLLYRVRERKWENFDFQL